MKLFKQLTILGLTIFTLIFTSSCGDNGSGGDPKPTQSVYGIISANSEYSLMTTAVDKAGLKAMLDGETTVTLFAADNDGILGAGLDVNSMTQTEAEEFVLYHLSDGDKQQEDLPADGYISSKNTSSLSGRSISIYVVTKNGSIQANTQQVVDSKGATNGRVHLMSGVLTVPNVFEALQLNPNINIYFTGVNFEAPMKDRLSGTTASTVFAGNETALTAYLNSQNKSMFSLAPALRRGLLNNTTIADKGKFTGELAGTETTLGKDMSTSGGGLTINSSIKVVQGNIQCSNGVIHIIDGVIPD